MTLRTLVIGCNGGIGKAIVSELRTVGYEVLGIDNGYLEKQSGVSFYVKADFRRRENVLRAAKNVKEHINDLWAIVYSAGLYPMVELKNYSIELWEEVFNINVNAAFLLLRDLSGLILSGGRIVTIVSGAVHSGSRDIGYSSSKAALLGLTRSLALNLSKRRILVNAICPGIIDTPMSRRMTPERMDRHRNRILVERLGTPQELALAVSFLLDPRNGYMTGSILDVDGGLHLG